MSHIGGDWYEDFDNGTPYYTNYTTAEVTWVRPTEDALNPTGGEGGEWVEKWDETQNCAYYQHSVTSESLWENPETNPVNWTSGLDESGYTYYYNSVTLVTVWDPPPCLSSDGTDTTAINTEVPKVEEEKEEVKKASVAPPPAPSKATIVPPPAPPKATVAPPPAPKKATVVPPATTKTATVAPPPAPKKATVVPPPAPPKATVVPPPAPKKATVVPPAASKKSSVTSIKKPASPKKLSLAESSLTTNITATTTTEQPTKSTKKIDIPSLPSPSSTNSVHVSDESKKEVSVATEGVKTLGLKSRPSKQTSFATLHSLDESSAGGKGGEDSDTEETPHDSGKMDLARGSMVPAPVEKAFGHRQSTIQMLPSKNDTSTHALCEQVFDVTFQQYGEKNYNFERKGLFKGRTTIEKMTTWKSDLIKTSLRILSSDLSSEAVQIFKNVTGYMGDRASSKSAIDHAIKILNQMMLAPEELRDELYCQLCKQTNGNPKPESTESGWQLFMIALATIPPSFDLMPHLMSYFVENLTNEIPNCAKYAEICLHRCPKICKLGARREIPTKLELETLRRGGVVTVRVFFLDGKYATLRADSWTTVRELEDAVSTLLKIENNEPFSLCEVSTSEEERVPDPDERILDIISFWDRTANEALAKGSDVEEFCFQYKIGLFYDIEDTDLSAIELLYIQATHDIVDSRYPCSEQDSITLAALQMQEEYGDYPGEGKCTYLRGNLGKYLAARLIQQSEASALEEHIYKLYSKLDGYSQLEARLSYLDYVKSWKIYGSTYFFVEPQNNKDLPKECVLAVNNKGVTVISPTTKEFLAEYNYSTVVTWGHSPNSFVIVTGTQTRQIKVYFKTEQGKELNNMVKCYIEHRKA